MTKIPKLTKAQQTAIDMIIDSPDFLVMTYDDDGMPKQVLMSTNSSQIQASIGYICSLHPDLYRDVQLGVQVFEEFKLDCSRSNKDVWDNRAEVMFDLDNLPDHLADDDNESNDDDDDA